MNRTSTPIGALSPTRRNSASSMTRSSLPCNCKDISAISSNNNVPPCACSNNPCLASLVPNALTALPNNSVSAISSEIVAQFNDNNGPSARPEASWQERAMSSLPVPVSPKINNGPSRSAMRLASFMTLRMASELA